MNRALDRSPLAEAMDRLGYPPAAAYSATDLASAVVRLSRGAEMAEPDPARAALAPSGGSEGEEGTETPESYPGAPRGPLAALEVRICTYAHATGAEVRHRGGALLLRATVAALPRALTAIERIPWDTLTEATPEAVRALHRAATIEGVTLGDLG